LKTLIDERVDIKLAGCSFNLLYVQLVLPSVTRVENILWLSLSDHNCSGKNFASWEECQTKNSVIFENEGREKLQSLGVLKGFNTPML